MTKEKVLAKPVVFNSTNQRAESAYRYGLLFLNNIFSTLSAGNTSKQLDALFNEGVPCIETINVDVRRKAAHTTLMSYKELVETRQRIMGIGNANVLYQLLDKR